MNTKISKSSRIIGIISIQFFIHFVVPPAQVNCVRKIFFINGILDPMICDVVNIVTLSTLYVTIHDTRQVQNNSLTPKQDWETLKINY